MRRNIVLTGSTGFIGRALVRAMMEKSFSVSLALRSGISPEHLPFFIVKDFRSSNEWFKYLINKDIVVHCAGKAHMINETVDLSELSSVNTFGTLNLARQCAKAGVKRFIFLSSINVNGIVSELPFTVNDTPNPIGFSAISKFEAEMGLWKIAAETEMEIVIIRAPLVYGPNAPGNFGKLCSLTSKSYPLPFGAINNKRSLVSLENLVDLIINCIDHPNAANQIFFVSDDNDISTTELLNEMTLASGNKPLLIPVPVSALRLAGLLTGKLSVIDRLCGNLQVDISHTKEVLGWEPPLSFQQGIIKCFQ